LIEAEIKVKISDPEEMKNKFRNFHGKHVLTLYHEDTYFNMPLKLRDFRKTDEALRIRKSMEFDPSNEGKSTPKINFFITYKGRKIDSTTKTRNEWETQVQDGEIMKTILKSLGFREIFTVKKEREFYEFIFNGEKIEVLIDYIPILKEHFIEVEMLVENEQELEKARTMLFNFLAQFGIKEHQSIRKSYLELIAERLKKR